MRLVLVLVGAAALATAAACSKPSSTEQSAPTASAATGAKIDPAGARQRRNQCLQDLAAAQAADRPGDRVAERSEIVVLERGPSAVSANGSGDNLENEIDQCFRHGEFSRHSNIERHGARS